MFSKAAFKNAADFAETTFKKTAVFEEAVFEETVQFPRVPMCLNDLRRDR